MRRPLGIFLILAFLGVLIAAGGFLLSRPGSGLAGLAGKRVLTLTLASALEDHAAQVPFILPGEKREPTLAAIWRGLAAARADDSVRGVALRIVDADFGLAKAAELRRQVAATVAAGKFVACYLETAGEGSNGTLEFYVAAACPTVVLAPAGELNLLGLYADGLFLRGALDKLKVEPSFLTSGRFKSAAEPFTEFAHSPAAREALDLLLDGYYRQIVAGIAEGRGLEPAAVSALIDRAPLSAAEALESGLVDGLEYPDQFDDRLEQLVGGEFESVDLLDYAERLPEAGGSERVAVVFARGTIVRGGGGSDPWSGESFVGSDGLGGLLSRLAEDDDVGAVVLRVDSPGGSALASDLILRRLELLAEAKPVVVSMSDLAASGGYYIAAKATRIVAEPGTLTGSIGVVTGKLATGRFQEELLGATHDVLTRGANAGIYSTLRPFDERERALVARRVDEIYQRFLDHVAAGRSLPREKVDELAQGRIWTGEDALARGLVDELGGLDAAVAAARAAAGSAADGALDFYPRPRSFFEWLSEGSGSPFTGELAAFARLLAASRAPFALELPRALAELARPF